ncbi:FAD binding domain-containing protein [Myxococcota bacterium]|nr:FAD binding domain-containing protein [Myxococcota bacterium]
MISFPKSIEAAAAGKGTLRAGGTDLQELRHLGVHQGDLVDLRDVAGLDRFELDEAGLHLGAGLSLATVATDPRVIDGFSGLAQAAGGLATPQIRNRATLAGSLLQEVRCWYYRNPHQSCAKKGGAVCLARQGDHLFHACFDRGMCVAPHPSTMAMALLAHDAQVELQDGSRLDIPTLLGDGSDPRRTHALSPGQVVVAVHLPLAEPLERAAYGRAISRARAEWPLVEVIARLWLDKKGKKLTEARVAIGGVANRPFALPAVEAALVGQEPTDEVLAAAAALATQGASPLPMTGYKIKLIPGIVHDVLLRALGDGLIVPPPPPVPEATGEVTP